MELWINRVRINHSRPVMCCVSILFRCNYWPQTNLREGYVFTCVCDSVHRGACMPCTPCHTLPPLPCMPPAMHVPTTHAPYHACPLPCMLPTHSLAMHTPCHAFPHHACPLPCRPPCHATPLPHPPPTPRYGQWAAYTSFWNASLLI